jgi:hypothetical protein
MAASESLNPSQFHGMDEKTYNSHYANGWTTSKRSGTLDRADADGRSSNDAWMDGYTDYAAGRERHHLKHCPDHGGPGCSAY